MIDFKRELIETADSTWIVRSSYVDEHGTPRSLQVRWDKKPTEEQLKGDHQFIEQKLLLADEVRKLKEAGVVISWKDVTGVPDKPKRNKSNRNSN